MTQALHVPLSAFQGDNTNTNYFPGLLTHPFALDGSYAPAGGVGSGAAWQLAMSPKQAWDFANNTKGLYFSVAAVIDYINGSGFEDADQLNGNGIIARFLAPYQNVYKWVYKSVNTGLGQGTNQVVIDFTQGYPGLQRTQTTPPGYWFLPKVTFNIAGNAGYITGGYGSDFMSFDNFSPAITGMVPISVTASNGGVTINSDIITESSIAQTERYDEIQVNKTTVSPGDVLTIKCPAHSPKYDYPAMRLGLKYATEVLFNGSAAPVTNFTTATNTNGVVDTLNVVVPADATSGYVQVTSQIGNSLSNTRDYFNLPQFIAVV